MQIEDNTKNTKKNVSLLSLHKKSYLCTSNRLMIKKLSIALVAILTLGSCAREFNKVYRTTDTDFK